MYIIGYSISFGGAFPLPRPSSTGVWSMGPQDLFTFLSSTLKIYLFGLFSDSVMMKHRLWQLLLSVDLGYLFLISENSALSNKTVYFVIRIRQEVSYQLCSPLRCKVLSKLLRTKKHLIETAITVTERMVEQWKKSVVHLFQLNTIKKAFSPQRAKKQNGMVEP